MVLSGFFSRVYGPNDDSGRRILWDELAGVFTMWDLPWCIGGDFNVTRFSSERLGFGGIGCAMEEFFNFISELRLLDILMMGGIFTWSNNRASQTWPRIERFLFSSSWDLLYPKVIQKRLSCRYSDYFPILLENGRCAAPKKPFYFENM